MTKHKWGYWKHGWITGLGLGVREVRALRDQFLLSRSPTVHMQFDSKWLCTHTCTVAVPSVQMVESLRSTGFRFLVPERHRAATTSCPRCSHTSALLLAFSSPDSPEIWLLPLIIFFLLPHPVSEDAVPALTLQTKPPVPSLSLYSLFVKMQWSHLLLPLTQPSISWINYSYCVIYDGCFNTSSC